MYFSEKGNVNDDATLITIFLVSFNLQSCCLMQSAVCSLKMSYIASFWQDSPKTLARYYKRTLTSQLYGDLGLCWHPVCICYLLYNYCIYHTWSKWKVNKHINTCTVSCVLFINNFEHYFLQGSLVLNKNLMKKYCKLVYYPCFLYNWYESQNVRFVIENGIQYLWLLILLQSSRLSYKNWA